MTFCFSWADMEGVVVWWHVSVSISEDAQPRNAVGTEVGTEVGGVTTHGADGLDVWIGSDGLNLTFHQLAV